MLTVAQRKTLIQAALGRERLDLKLANVQLVNVYTGMIEAASLDCGPAAPSVRDA